MPKDVVLTVLEIELDERDRLGLHTSLRMSGGDCRTLLVGQSRSRTELMQLPTLNTASPGIRGARPGRRTVPRGPVLAWPVRAPEAQPLNLVK